MWSNRSVLLAVRVRLRGMRPRLRLFLPLFLPVLHQLLLSFDGLICLVPGRYGAQAQGAFDAVHSLLLGAMESQPQQYADIRVRDGKKEVVVKVSTIGWKGGEKQ